MMYKFPDLDYPYDALEPYIDEETMWIHHTKHHQKYIDPRTHQWVLSRMADSQSISAGNNLSHMNILQQKKNTADREPDQLLNKEGSRINFPLKINVSIVTDYQGKSLRSMPRKYPYSILVANSNPTSSTTSSLGKLLSLLKEMKEAVFIVQPGFEFHKPGKAFLLTNFSQDDHLPMKQVYTWLKSFDTLIHACIVIRMELYTDMELNAKMWKQLVTKYLDPSLFLNPSLLKGEDLFGTLLDFTRRNDPDLVILPKDQKPNTGNQLISKKDLIQLFNKLNKPVLLY
jgi:hypothetical protein